MDIKRVIESTQKLNFVTNQEINLKSYLKKLAEQLHHDLCILSKHKDYELIDVIRKISIQTGEIKDKEQSSQYIFLSLPKTHGMLLEEVISNGEKVTLHLIQATKVSPLKRTIDGLFKKDEIFVAKSKALDVFHVLNQNYARMNSASTLSHEQLSEHLIITALTIYANEMDS
jgi:hypothetical protein